MNSADQRDNQKEKKMDSAMRIFEALSGVDEELLVRSEESVEAAPSGKIRPFWYYGRVLAACFCLVVCGAILLRAGSMVLRDKASSADCAVNLEMAQEAALDYGESEGTTGAMAEDGITGAAGSVQEASSEEQAAVTEGSPAEAAAAEQEEKYTGQTSQAIKDTIDQVETEKQDLTAQLGNQNSQSQSDIADTESCSVDSREKLTLEAAKADVVLGEYVPETLPAGFIFESASRSTDAVTGETDSISLCWTKGMDSLNLTISRVDAAAVDTVDISRPEIYDVHLYEIPYAETVPESYSTSFNNPVFAEKDFALDTVEARMKVVADQGDTETPRGNFAVLYENGILVEFSGHGDAESIYEIFQSIR